MAALEPGHPVQILPGSKTAVVDLSLPKSATTPASLAQMASQLVWTLTSSSYGSAAIQAVKLEVNGHLWIPPGANSAVLSRRNYPQPALEPPGREDLYFLASNGAVRVLGREGSSAVPGQAGTGQVSAERHRRLTRPALPGGRRGDDALHEFPGRCGEAARQRVRAGPAGPDERRDGHLGELGP